MDILHSGYKNNKILEIVCDEFEITITGNPGDKKSSNLDYNKNVMAKILINGKYENEVTVNTIDSYGQMVDSKNETMLPCFYENGEYQIVLVNKTDSKYKIAHMDSDLSNNMQTFANVNVGLIKFDSNIGYSTFNVIKDQVCILSFTIEVFPSKVDYKTDYKEIVSDINEEISSLAFEILGKTYLNTVLKDTNKQTNSEYINILKYIFKDLEKDINRMCNHFKHNIQTTENIKSVEKSRITSRKTVDYIRKHPSSLNEDRVGFVNIENKSYIPTKVVDKRKITTIDIYENRYIKYIISNIIKRLVSIEKNIAKVYKNENLYINFIKGKRILLEKYLKIHFNQISDLKDPKSMSLVFQISPGYKGIYKKYIILKKGLALGEDLYKMTPKKLYNLYEIWCYIKIHHLLRDMGYKVKEPGIIKYSDNGLYLSLIQDKEAKTIYSNGSNEINLWYNKSYSLPTTNQRPDIVLSIKSSKNNEERIYIFDAKYRINTDSNEIGPVEEDINVMHKYRDSIVSELKETCQFKYDTFGADVMFPYSDEKKFINNKFYKSIEQVNIGALPMLPGSIKLMEHHLRKIIGESLLEAKSNRIIQDELDDYSKFKDRNVMVVNTFDPEHYNAYMEHKFYHIPKGSLSKVRLGVKYLAFYKSRNNFGEDCGIQNYAIIRNVYEYKRSECKELKCKKGKENEVYLRFEFDEVIKINNIEPIQAKGLISYTTVYLLKNASNMHMLNIKSNFEVKVYKKLNDISSNIGEKVKKENDKYYLNNHEIEVLSNNNIRVDGKFIEYKNLEYIINPNII